MPFLPWAMQLVEDAFLVARIRAIEASGGGHLSAHALLAIAFLCEEPRPPAEDGVAEAKLLLQALLQEREPR